jgi:hypothetical protein
MTPNTVVVAVISEERSAVRRPLWVVETFSDSRGRVIRNWGLYFLIELPEDARPVLYKTTFGVEGTVGSFFAGFILMPLVADT